MRALKAAVVIMGVLIIVGVMFVGTVIVRRSLAPAPGTAGTRVAEMVLDEPPGTHIAEISPLPEGTALRLEGGGPDRVVVVDLRSGRRLGSVRLAH